MIQTICIAELLREAIAGAGGAGEGGSETRPYTRSDTRSYARPRNLVTRPTGAAVRGRIEAALARSECLTTLLDFSDIELLDLSCADEVVAKLLIAERGRASRYLALQGLREDQHEAIEHVLTGHRLAVAAVPPGTSDPRLLGWVPADARHAFACLCARGALDPPGLARALGWPLHRATAALGDLALLRVVRPEKDLFHPLPGPLPKPLPGPHPKT